MNRKIKRTAALLTGIATVMSCASGYAPLRQNEASAAQSVIAFPGAVGGGKYATGGRGGEVVHVTNLNDSGAGSFRDAVSKSNRIVVFDVSGTIELEGNILVSSNVTIAGQTAPGGSGITLKNYKLGMSGDNIICRYLSSRPGPYKATSSGNDAWGGAKGSSSIIDHCSMSWTTDEQWGLYSNNEYYTVQYSIIGPADSWGGHSKGIHGFGLMMGKGYSTFDHNLIIHNVSRNFRGKVTGTETADFTNNVIYDWAYQTAYGTIGHLNYVNNTLKAGNCTTGGYHYVNVDSTTSPQNFRIYLSGNRLLNKDNSVNGSVTYDNWAGITVKDGIGITKDDLVSNSSFATTVNGENVSTAMTCESAEASYEHVVSYAGNGISPDLRTAVDKQCAYETQTGTGYLSGTAAYSDADSTQKANLDKYKIQCGVTYTYPPAVLQKTITDNDNDGMADEWEIERGLDPTDPTDTNGDYCGQGYTNIEYYINDLTVDSFPQGVVTLSPTEGIETRSAFDRIEAESYDEQSGVSTEACSEGGENVGYIENGDYIMFRNVSFTGGAKSFNAHLAGNAAKIEICLDKLSDTPDAVCSFEGSSGFQEWTDASFNVGNITGVHDVYLRFTGGSGYLLNIDSFSFGKDKLPLNGKLFRNISVFDTENADDWKLSYNTSAGSLIYGDRDFTFTSFPNELTGAEQLLTACDSKNSTSDLASFEAGSDMTVYTVLDTRVENLPSWLSDWTLTDMTCSSSNDVSFAVYSRELSKGEKLTLGTNGQSSNCMNYTVLAKEKETASLIGDINLDGEVNTADVIMLQKHILCKESLPPEKAELSDMDGNGMTDVFDLIKLKRQVIK